MIQNEKHSNNNIALVNIKEKRTRTNWMKYWWCETVNNTECYHQTPFNIALILEQVSSYNNAMRE